MMPFIAKQIIAKQQEVTSIVLRYAEKAKIEGDDKYKEEFLTVAGKCVEVEKSLLIHIPRD